MPELTGAFQLLSFGRRAAFLTQPIDHQLLKAEGDIVEAIIWFTFSAQPNSEKAGWDTLLQTLSKVRKELLSSSSPPSSLDSLERMEENDIDQPPQPTRSVTADEHTLHQRQYTRITILDGGGLSPLRSPPSTRANDNGLDANSEQSRTVDSEARGSSTA